MTTPKTALLLVGSPRGKGSTSYTIGSYLFSKLESDGLQTETINIYPALKTDEGRNNMLLEVAKADLVVVSFPLYADAPTAAVIEMMQLIAEQRTQKVPPFAVKTLEQIASLLENDKVGVAAALIAAVVKVPFLPAIIAGVLLSALKNRDTHKKAAKQIRTYLKSQEPREQRLAVICNSGFLEPERSTTAIDICRKFADDTNIEWVGSLVFGGGPFIDGKPLEKLGRPVRKLRQGLELAAADLAKGSQISPEASNLVSTPPFSGWMYIFMGRIGWLIQAWKNKVLGRLNDRPYKT